MPKKLLLSVCASALLFNGVAKADELFTTVFNVFESKKTETLLVLSAADGRIYKTFKSEENLKRMKSLIGQVVRLDYTVVQGDEARINAIRPIVPGEVDPKVVDLNNFRYNELRQVAPTDFQSLEEVENIFNNFLNDGDKGRSECFKRAHIWSYDMWSKLNVTSEKIFIFWTKRFTILEDYEWWFHVAPMVKVNGTEYVLDSTFFKKPETVETWRNYFMNSDKINCPIVDKYQDYENNQWNKLCYIMKVPMHYFRPFDIEDRDKKGIERNHWVLDELQDARRSFWGWDKKYEGLDTGKPTKKH